MGESGADCSLMLKKGLDFIQQATAADSEGRIREAIRLYSLGLESLLSVLKFERNERITATLRVRVREYMARAEQLKAQLTSPEAPSPSLALPTPPAALPLDNASPAQVNASPARTLARVATPAESRPPVASPKNAMSPPAPTAAHSPPPEVKGPKRVVLQDGQLGCSYEAVLGPHLVGSTDLTLCYPLLHSEYHIRNLLSFVELLVKQETCRLVTLETSPAPNSDDATAVSGMLSEVVSSAAERGVHIQVQSCDAETAPYILTATGRLISLPRALDWFGLSSGQLVVGSLDFNLRPARYTVIEMCVLRSVIYSPLPSRKIYTCLYLLFHILLN